jgi:hypothetical protein
VQLDRTLLALLVLAILVLLFALMLLGWRLRQRRQSGLQHPESPPVQLGEILGSFSGMYVATTLAGDPLNRVAVRGLGFRAKTSVTVAAVGIVVPIAGQTDILIPVTSIRSATRADWVIDKAVEPGGLSVVGWSLGGTAVDSYFRLDAPIEFQTIVIKLIDGSGRNSE